MDRASQVVTENTVPVEGSTAIPNVKVSPSWKLRSLSDSPELLNTETLAGPLKASSSTYTLLVVGSTATACAFPLASTMLVPALGPAL